MLQFTQDADWVGPRVYAPASLTLLVAGIFLVEEAGYDFGDLWVSLGLLVWVASFAVGVGYYGRAAKQQAAIVDAGGLESDEFLALYRRVKTVGNLETLLLVLIVADMTIKPG